MTGLVGQYIGRYHIVERLGEGGMATVYKGYDTRLERDVAIKIIRTDAVAQIMHEQLLKRFEREAKSLAKMDHRGIVNVFDYGEHNNAPYLVMEYLPGGTLKELTGKPCPFREAALLVPIAQALAYAHSKGIIHRDVKPSNILITRNGDPLLSDFGIAKLLESEQTTQITGTGMGIGTPEYMAPEQWSGKVTAQTDIYALGIIFFELVTGNKPFTADTPAAILLKQAMVPLPRPRDIIPDLPDSAEKALFKALAKDPAQRYDSMADFAAVLSSLAATPEGAPAGLQKQGPDWAETMVRETPPRPPARTLAPPSQFTPPPSPIPRPQTSPQWSSQTSAPPKTGAARPKSPQPAAARSWLKNPVFWGAAAVMILIGLAGLAAAVSSLITFANRYADPADFTALQDYSFSAAGYHIDEISAGENGLIYFSWDSSGKREIYSVDLTGTLTQLTETKADGESFSPTAAGEDVYFASNQDGKFEIYQHIPGGSPVKITSTPGDGESFQPAAGPGGELYFASNRSGSTEVYRLDAGGTTRLTETPGGADSWEPSPGAKGSIYFTSNRDGKYEIYQLDPSGELTRITDTPGSINSWEPSARPDGVVFFTSDRSGENRVHFINRQGAIEQIAYDESVCWSAAAEGGKAVIFLADKDGISTIYRLKKE